MRKQLLLRGAIGASAASLLAGALTIMPASAGTNMVTACGTVITSAGHWAVASDLGPCTGMGIVIRHNGVTLNLMGHTITGNDTANHTTNEQLGVLFANVKGSKVVGSGTITGFDAGVAVLGGTQDSVSGVITHDNINHVLFPYGGVADSNGIYGDPQVEPCNYGDGIITDNSTYDVISGNTSYHNGPFSGIALVDSSTNNLVTGNDTYNQLVYNQVFQPTTNTYTSGPCGPFQSQGVGVGRPDQDIGIRVEGPGATNNVVSNNNSHRNMLEGISIHGHVCPISTTPPPTPDNAFNTVANNTVTGNGNDTFAPGSPNGIGVLQQGPANVVCPSDNATITGNTSTGNADDGIFVAGRGEGNDTVTGNTVSGNAHDGIELSGTSGPLPGAVNDSITGNSATSNSHDGIELDSGAAGNSLSGNTASGNTTFDGADGNTSCGTNTWSGDTFTTTSQSCVH